MTTKVNGGRLGKGLTLTSTSKSGIFGMDYMFYNMSNGYWSFANPPTIVAAAWDTANTGIITIPAGCTSIKVYGCAGGGNGSAAPANLAGGAGGAGAAAQLSGYTLSVTPGENLTYYAGKAAESTFINRSASAIFTLSPGGSGSSSTGGSAPAAGTYGSHAGGAGGNGGGRFTVGTSATNGAYCGGGGGGGGYGDSSPLTAGAGGGAGANNTILSAVSIAGSSVTFTGASGGAAVSYNTAGNGVPDATGGALDASNYWYGGGGSAGGGIKVSSIASGITAFGGGGGGGGGYTGAGGHGGPGFLIIEYL